MQILKKPFSKRISWRHGIFLDERVRSFAHPPSEKKTNSKGWYRTVVFAWDMLMRSLTAPRQRRSPKAKAKGKKGKGKQVVDPAVLTLSASEPGSDATCFCIGRKARCFCVGRKERWDTTKTRETKRHEQWTDERHTANKLCEVKWCCGFLCVTD